MHRWRGFGVLNLLNSFDRHWVEFTEVIEPLAISAAICSIVAERALRNLETEGLKARGLKVGHAVGTVEDCRNLGQILR